MGQPPRGPEDSVIAIRRHRAGLRLVRGAEGPLHLGAAPAEHGSGCSDVVVDSGDVGLSRRPGRVRPEEGEDEQEAEPLRRLARTVPQEPGGFDSTTAPGQFARRQAP
jgi:hypothetical protein